MADRIQSYKVISAGGLNSNENHLDLAENSPGAATRLVNYEASLFGGYRRINGYAPFDSNSEIVPGQGKILCVALYKDDTFNNAYVIAARQDTGASTYSFYKHVPLSGWQQMSTGYSRTVGTTLDPLKTINHVDFNFGAGNHLAFADGINPPIVFDGTNWKELAVSGTGGSSSPGGPMLLENPALVDVFENHLFFSGETTNKSTICHGAPNDPYTFTSAAGAGQLTIGFDVVQFKPFREDLFVFGGNAIKKIKSDITAGFVLDQVTTNVGCIASNSVIEIGGDLVFLAPDGLRPVAGTSRIGDVELETISKNIQSLLVDMPVDFNLDNVLTSVVVRTKSQFRYFIGDDTISNSDSAGIIGALRTADQQLGWEFGELLGIRASCATSGYIGQNEYVLHGDYNGGVYRQEQGDTFNGGGIIGVYSTPYYDFGDTEVRKILRKVNTFIRSEGPLEMNISVSYDWDDTSTAKPPSYAQASTGAPVIYAGRNIFYGGTNVKYGGNEKPIMSTDIQGSGYAVKVTYVTLGAANASHSIQGMVFEFSVAGRN
tara:strand:- start:506 stop:2140 length:1635 start_codon:yes stop_codon:yes gene_type:complete